MRSVGYLTSNSAAGQKRSGSRAFPAKEAFHVQHSLSLSTHGCRHENCPLAESRRRYLEHLAAQGAAIHTIRMRASRMILKMLRREKPSARSALEPQHEQRHCDCKGAALDYAG